MTLYTLVTGDFVTTGGMDVANHALARYLAGRGEEVHLVAHHVEEKLAQTPGVKVHRVVRPFRSYLLGWPVLDLAGRAWARRTQASGGRTVVNGGNCAAYDVNWVHYVHAAYVAGEQSPSMRRRLATSAYVRAEQRIVPRARVVIANSQRTKRDLVERVGVPEARVRVVYYGIDADRFRPANQEERHALRMRLQISDTAMVAMFVGALGDRRKGFDVLYDAWRSLCGTPGWDGLLLVVGRGAELPRWEARTVADGLSQRIRFLGFRSDVPDLIRASDVLVAPTRYEAYGLGVHEALCTGVPALVSSSAGVAERYPDGLKTLLLQDPESAADLSSALTRWRSSAAQLKSAVSSLSDALRAETWDVMAERFVRAIA